MNSPRPTGALTATAQQENSIIINYTEDKTDETEIFEEIISMLHCFAMKMYSKRRKRKLEIVQEDLKNEISL